PFEVGCERPASGRVDPDRDRTCEGPGGGTGDVSWPVPGERDHRWGAVHPRCGVAGRRDGGDVVRFIGIDYSTTSTGIAIVDGAHWQTFTLRSKPKGDTLSAYYERIQDLAHDIVAAVDLRLGDVVAI